MSSDRPGSSTPSPKSGSSSMQVHDRGAAMARSAHNRRSSEHGPGSATIMPCLLWMLAQQRAVNVDGRRVVADAASAAAASLRLCGRPDCAGFVAQASGRARAIACFLACSTDAAPVPSRSCGAPRGSPAQARARSGHQQMLGVFAAVDAHREFGQHADRGNRLLGASLQDARAGVCSASGDAVVDAHGSRRVAAFIRCGIMHWA